MTFQEWTPPVCNTAAEKVEHALTAERIRLAASPVPAQIRERVLQRMVLRTLEGAR